MGFSLFATKQNIKISNSECVEKSYPDLESVPVTVDIVDIFRKVDAIPAIVDDAITIKAGAVWMQLGLAHNVSAKKARDAGLEVIQSKCIKIEHNKLF